MSSGRARPTIAHRPVRSLAGRSGSSRSPLSTSSASTVCRRRCRYRSMPSPPSGRRAPTLLWCTALRRTGRKSFSSPISKPFSITAAFSPTSQRGRGRWRRAVERTGILSWRPGRSSDISNRTGSWPSKSRPGSIRPKPCFSPPRASRAAGSSFALRSTDGDPPLGRGVELQGRRSGRGGAARRVPSRDFLQVRSPAFVEAQAESLSWIGLL
jgi:hypothetical protein